MRKGFVSGLAAVVAFCVLSVGASVRAADEFAIDSMHSGINFKISHLGLSWIHGRFDDFSGTFALDPADPSKCAFGMTIKTQGIDTNNTKRDDHLRSPDFFNAKQFPAISFQSTEVKPMKDGYQVTGNLTLHGVTKPVSFALVGGRKAEFPKGTQRTGFSTELTIKRSDFGISKFGEAVGDDVHIAVSFEGTKK